MQFSTSIVSFILAASSVLAQNSICGSQIYQPGTGQCFNGQLCLYATNPSTGLANIITYPCGSTCFDAAKYTCNNGVLVVATGTASTAVLSSTAAQTSTQGATASATPVQSGAVISSQSRAASSAARVAASTSSANAASSSSSKTSAGTKLAPINEQFVAIGGLLVASVLAGLMI